MYPYSLSVIHHTESTALLACALRYYLRVDYSAVKTHSRTRNREKDPTVPAGLSQGFSTLATLPYSNSKPQSRPKIERRMSNLMNTGNGWCIRPRPSIVGRPNIAGDTGAEGLLRLLTVWRQGDLPPSTLSQLSYVP